MIRPLTALVLGLVVAPAVRAQAPALAPPPRPFTPDDVLRVRDVNEPRISPEGDWVANTVSSVDTAEVQNHEAIWMSRWDGKRPIR